MWNIEFETTEATKQLQSLRCTWPVFLHRRYAGASDDASQDERQNDGVVGKADHRHEVGDEAYRRTRYASSNHSRNRLPTRGRDSGTAHQPSVARPHPESHKSERDACVRPTCCPCGTLPSPVRRQPAVHGPCPRPGDHCRDNKPPRSGSSIASKRCPRRPSPATCPRNTAPMRGTGQPGTCPSNAWPRGRSSSRGSRPTPNCARLPRPTRRTLPVPAKRCAMCGAASRPIQSLHT